MKRFFLAVGVLLVVWSNSNGRALASGADLVKEGKDPRPIIVDEKAPESTQRAADELAKIIGRISGATPKVLNTLPENTPGAIWIGHHDKLPTLFPGTDFTWKHPEEILILSRDNNVAILGRDKLMAETEVEAGTANAVYTFAQKYLGVRWLWPGTLGEDYPSNPTISVAETNYRFHPIFVQRAVFRNLGQPGPNSQAEWCLRQRLYYDSFDFPVGHAFGTWWDKYGKTHPEYFALQPDGTRGTFPERSNRKKLCEGEPGVWTQWLNDAGEIMAAKPAQRVLNASPNDSSNSGICVDPRSKAWDHPKAKLWRYEWAGVSKEELAMSNRYVTFWNTLAKMLKEKYPDKDVVVGGFAYGPSKPAPIDLKIEDNVAIGYVGHLPMLDDKRRAEEYADIRDWSKLTKNLFFRPNVSLYSGGFHAVPSVIFGNTIKDFRFLAENGCRGVVIDTLPDHWGTQGPMYYLMTQLAWDPLQDGEAVLADYYQRAFGPAAKPVRAYFELMEKAHMALIERPDWIHSGRMAKPLSEFMIAEAFTPEILAQGQVLLQEAATLAKGNEKYSQRVQFINKGLDFTGKIIATMKVMNRVRSSQGTDTEAVAEAGRLVAEREAFFESENEAAKKSKSIAPISSHRFKITYSQARAMYDYLGPVSEAFQKAAASGKPAPTPAAKKEAAPTASTAEGTDFRWTGKAGNKLWATPGNWEVKTASGWKTAVRPPGPGSTVYLGDEAGPEERELNLTGNTTIARILVVAANEAGYIIQTRPDADTEGLDSDSGMLFTLTLTDPAPIGQNAETKGGLGIRSKLALSGGKRADILLASTSGAPIEILGQLTGAPSEKREGGNAKGRLILGDEAKAAQ